MPFIQGHANQCTRVHSLSLVLTLQLQALNRSFHLAGLPLHPSLRGVRNGQSMDDVLPCWALL
jgi:hypothetical protein